MLKNITLLLPCFVSLFWVAFFFFNGKKNSRSQSIWMMVMVLLAITSGIAAFYWFFDGDYSLYYKLDIIDGFVSLSIVPLILLYFTEITGDHKKWPLYQILLLFLPALLIGGSTALLYFSVGDEQATLYMREIMENKVPNSATPFFRTHYTLLNHLYIPVFFIQILAACFYIIRILLSYRKRLDEFFSNPEGKSFEHHWAIVRGLFFFLILLAVIAQAGYLLYIDYSVGVSVSTTFLGVIIYYLCYHVYRTNYTAESFENDLAQADREIPEESVETDILEGTDPFHKFHDKIYSEFDRLIYAEEIFLQKDIRLDEIARLLNANRSYVSRFINEEYGCNFAEFINNKRIAYAKELIRANPKLTQEQIAEQSGFTYATTFSRVFKQYVGVTFRRFMKEQR